MKKALLVLDPQNVYTQKNSELFCMEAGRTIDKINKLIHAMTDLEQLVILIKHVHKVDGSDLGRLFDFTGEAEPDFNFKEGTPEVEYDARIFKPKNAIELKKNRYSAFVGTSLDNILKDHDIKKVIICGFMTNFCCESTARASLDLDYYVDFVVDATGTPGTDNFSQKKIRGVVAELLSAGFARVLNTRDLLNQIKKG